MAQWSDPRVTGTQSSLAGVGTAAGDVPVDAGLRAHMLKVYNYMASGVLLTGIVAMLFAQTEVGQSMFTNPGILFWVVMLAPLAIVFTFNYNRSEQTLHVMFWVYAVLTGLGLAGIFLRFTGDSIAQTFFASAAAFAGLSLWGYTTKKDLTGWGSFLIMGLVGLLVAMLLNFWLQSDTLQWVISSAGVLVFAGLTAYDTQRIKSEYFMFQGSGMIGKAAIVGALHLYIDLIGLFQFLLSFLGERD